MALREELQRQGDWFFRWRSYLPLIMIVIILLGMFSYQYPGDDEIYDDIWEMICLVISLSGVGIRFFTVGYVAHGTSGTNTGAQMADSLNTNGMYSIVRHPLYLGNFIIWFGLASFYHLWWFSLIVILVFWLYYERIMFTEEEFLREKFGPVFLEWAEKTPAFMPNFRNWRSSHLTFSFRKALKNEYKSVFAVVVAFAFLEIISDVFVAGKLEIDRVWLSIIVISGTVYSVIRWIKKKTTILDDRER